MVPKVRGPSGGGAMEKSGTRKYEGRGDVIAFVAGIYRVLGLISYPSRRSQRSPPLDRCLTGDVSAGLTLHQSSTLNVHKLGVSACPQMPTNNDTSTTSELWPDGGA